MRQIRTCCESLLVVFAQYNYLFAVNSLYAPGSRPKSFQVFCFTSFLLHSDKMHVSVDSLFVNRSSVAMSDSLYVFSHLPSKTSCKRMPQLPLTTNNINTDILNA